MSSRFVRNIIKSNLGGTKNDRNHENIEPLYTNTQNDILSDENNDVYVRTGDNYHCVTDNVKTIINEDEMIIIDDLDNNHVELSIDQQKVRQFMDRNKVHINIYFNEDEKKLQGSIRFLDGKIFSNEMIATIDITSQSIVAIDLIKTNDDNLFNINKNVNDSQIGFLKSNNFETFLEISSENGQVIIGNYKIVSMNNVKFYTDSSLFLQPFTRTGSTFDFTDKKVFLSYAIKGDFTDFIKELTNNSDEVGIELICYRFDSENNSNQLFKHSHSLSSSTISLAYYKEVSITNSNDLNNSVYSIIARIYQGETSNLIHSLPYEGMRFV